MLIALIEHREIALSALNASLNVLSHLESTFNSALNRVLLFVVTESLSRYKGLVPDQFICTPMGLDKTKLPIETSLVPRSPRALTTLCLSLNIPNL